MEEVISIVVIVYVVAEAVKTTPIDNKFIPVIVSVAGAVVAVSAKATGQLFVNENWIDAISIGISSGLASVGLNQFKKQLRG